METYLTDLKKHAAREGYTLPGLFRAAGIPRQTLSNWLRGKHSPNLVTLDKLYAVKRAPRAPTAAGGAHGDLSAT